MEALIYTRPVSPFPRKTPDLAQTGFDQDLLPVMGSKRTNTEFGSPGARTKTQSMADPHALTDTHILSAAPPQAPHNATWQYYRWQPRPRLATLVFFASWMNYSCTSLYFRSRWNKESGFPMGTHILAADTCWASCGASWSCHICEYPAIIHCLSRSGGGKKNLLPPSGWRGRCAALRGV
jgi:hypothetical protein